MIIGISGKINSGKDTVGKIIQILTQSPHFTNEGVLNFLDRKMLDPKFTIEKFGGKLKDIVCLLIGCTREQLEDEVFKNTELGEEWWYYKGNTKLFSYYTSYKANKKLPLIKLTPRLMLQFIGTECMRDVIHPNTWVNALMSEYVGNLNCTPDENKRLLSIWKNMNTRCTNPNYQKFHKYGGKGITIYSKWKDFEVFKLWALSNGYTNTLTLDRKDTNGNYEPNNCRFVTTSLQAFNKNSYDNSTSSIKGVNKHQNGKWQAQIQSKGKKKNLGCYITEKLAKAVYVKAYNKLVLELEYESKQLQRDNYPNWIITDVRFENELKAVENRKGITIRINRYINPCVCVDDSSLDCLVKCDKKPQHESETALDNAEFDHIIYNNGNLNELIDDVRYILTKEKLL